MYSFLRRFLMPGWLQRKRIFYVLFCCGLWLAISATQPNNQLGQFIGVGSSAIAQESSPTQRVQRGVEAYQAGEYADAISHWQQALEDYPANAQADRALINENLARAQQQVGAIAAALGYWEAAATHYKADGNATQFGRMLTEQAQAYISNGQQQRAVALLCGEKGVTISDEASREESATASCGGKL